METIFAKDVQVGQTVMVREGQERTIERMKYDDEHLILFWCAGDKFFCLGPGAILGLVSPAPPAQAEPPSASESEPKVDTGQSRRSSRPDPSKVLERDLRAFVLGMDDVRRPARPRGPRPNLDRYDRIYEG